MPLGVRDRHSKLAQDLKIGTVIRYDLPRLLSQTPSYGFDGPPVKYRRAGLTGATIRRVSKAPKIDGYTQCSNCGRLELTVIAARTGGVCNGCVLAGVKPTLEIQDGGRVFQVKRSGLRKHPPKKLTPARRERIKTRDRARANALRELSKLYPVEFATILASERAKLGLTPWTIDAALKAQLADIGMEVPK